MGTDAKFSDFSPSDASQRVLGIVPSTMPTFQTKMMGAGYQDSGVIPNVPRFGVPATPSFGVVGRL